MAFNRTTYVSSENSAFHAGRCASRNAVDGDRGTPGARCCSLTDLEDNPWWAVELLSDAKTIAKVVITNGGAFGRILPSFRDDCRPNTYSDSINKIN